MSARRTMPRRGLADPGWKYVNHDTTDIRKTFAAERARLASEVDAFLEREAVRAAICELHDAPADVPLPMPLRSSRSWDFTQGWRGSAEAQAGRLDTDAAVALAALALLAAAARFGGLVG